MARRAEKAFLAFALLAWAVNGYASVVGLLRGRNPSLPINLFFFVAFSVWLWSAKPWRGLVCGLRGHVLRHTYMGFYPKDGGGDARLSSYYLCSRCGAESNRAEK